MDPLSNNTSQAAQQANQLSNVPVGAFVAALSAGLVGFAVQFLLFNVLSPFLPRIYRPKTYLVPEKERTNPPPKKILGWLWPIFSTTNSEFILKCGLDSYFFLRYLRMLLKIYIPLALLILPILLPTNNVDSDIRTTKGLDKFAWQNIPANKQRRKWAHLVLAVVVIIWCCYIFTTELRGYIRVRQAYLVSPQHRLRASATTVLVNSIPRKWLTPEALDGLFDVYPGGIRNIWINRNFDELDEKVQQRDKIARALEGAETDLVKKCKAAATKKQKKAEKEYGIKKSRQERKDDQKNEDAAAEELANRSGHSANNPHQVAHTVQEALGEVSSSESSRASSPERPEKNPVFRVPVLGRGFEAVTHGLGAVERGIRGLPRNVVGRVEKGVEEFNQGVERANDGPGLVIDDDTAHLRERPDAESSEAPARESHSVDSDTTAVQPNIRDAPTRMIAKGPASSDKPKPEPFSAAKHRLPDRNLEEELQRQLAPPKKRFGFLPNGGKALDFPSPEPHVREEDGEFPIEASKADEKSEYPSAYNEEYYEDIKGAKWMEYIDAKDRDTYRIPIFSWMPSLPLIGKKVDKIYYFRKELARLNVEIEEDQQHPENYPLMNSAFIQFNHQVAAHMCCQSLAHHLPQHMTPRIVEISPEDVIWENLSVKWWERFLRRGSITLLVVGLNIAWAIPVSAAGSLSQISYLANFSWLNWITKLPPWLVSAVQGILPPALIALLLVLLPILLRFMAKLTGVPTKAAVTLTVQNFYFGFLFVQLFLVVTVASGLSATINEIINNPVGTPQYLAKNLPLASNYFISFILLQGLAVSAGNLVQVAALISWFIFGRLFDSTPRAKWNRQIDLPKVDWGTYATLYTVIACIGLIYSVISPLIMLFNIGTFALFWIVNRYKALFVNQYQTDTGGIIFPKAINQTFTGLYFLEIALVGLFALSRDENDNAACIPQAIIMLVFIFLTAGYQALLNNRFSPMYRYIPVTLEDDAVVRDEEYARIQARKFGRLVEEEQPGDNIEDVLEERERREEEEEGRAEEIEMEEIKQNKERRSRRESLRSSVLSVPNRFSRASTWATRPGHHNIKDSGAAIRDRSHSRSRTHSHSPHSRLKHQHRGRRAATEKLPGQDIEAQQTIAERLYGGFHDEIEDLTPEERDQLVQRAFQHRALRARRPVVWIPRDDLGVSDNEIKNTARFSNNIWISNEYTGLDSKVRAVFKRSPPDFSEVDLIRL